MPDTSLDSKASSSNYLLPLFLFVIIFVVVLYYFGFLSFGTKITTPAITSTMAPTTMAPTTMAPTTMEPTTMVPTTMVPTTMVPTTMVPTTMAPTTMAPTTPPISMSNPLFKIPVNKFSCKVKDVTLGDGYYKIAENSTECSGGPTGCPSKFNFDSYSNQNIIDWTAPNTDCYVAYNYLGETVEYLKDQTLEFDGTGYIDIPFNTGLMYRQSGFTFNFYIKLDAQPADLQKTPGIANYIIFGDTSTMNLGITDNKIEFNMYDAKQKKWITLTGNKIVADGKWHQIVLVRDFSWSATSIATPIILYIDDLNTPDSQNATDFMSNTDNPAVFTKWSVKIIGGGYNSNQPGKITNFYKGKIKRLLVAEYNVLKNLATAKHLINTPAYYNFINIMNIRKRNNYYQVIDSGSTKRTCNAVGGVIISSDNPPLCPLTPWNWTCSEEYATANSVCIAPSVNPSDPLQKVKCTTDQNTTNGCSSDYCWNIVQ